MNKAFAIKLGVIALIALLLNVPLEMIVGKSHERSAYKQQAKNSIAQSWTSAQKIVGPVISIPYTEKFAEKVWDENLKAYKDETREVKKCRWIVPESISIESNINNDIRYKGIYEVPVYTTTINIDGQIAGDQIGEIKNLPNVIEVGQPVISFTVSDPRGISSIPKLYADNKEYIFKPGSKLGFNAGGIHVELPEALIDGKERFSLDLELRGMENLSFVPVAKEVELAMRSTWPHPSFTGSFLPIERDIDESGYSATWKVTSFASNIEQKIKSCSSGRCDALLGSDFGVTHIEPVDTYLQTERSVKYGFLFIMLSFVTFFIFEILRKMSIHAVQYTLVGLAVAIFYLLLLALSEHIPFIWAYVIATASCVTLIQAYLSAILASKRHALVFTGIFTLLYGVLYQIIQSEDFALLMGSLLSFVALVVLMLGTRHVDWFQVGEQLNKVRPTKTVSKDSESYLI